MVVTLRSPKQPPGEHLKDWYPYYAGFTSAFVADVFDRYLRSVRFVVDPWNGSGTTTAVAAARNVMCMGIDVNPALSIIARARLTPRSMVESLAPIAADIAAAAECTTPMKRSCDPLSVWLAPGAKDDIRRLQRAIHVVTAADDALEVELCMGDQSAPSRLPLIAAFFYSVLFAATRDLLGCFRASNPTWLVAPSTPQERLKPAQGTIRARFLQRVDYLSGRLQSTSRDSDKMADIRTGRASELLSDGHSFDACLGSPPYATRIDYVKASIPELSVLGLSESAIATLRRKTTGTPVVRGVARAGGRLPAEAQEVIERVAEHESHGSANYYAPWLRNYLTELNHTLGLIAARVKPGGRIGLVLQDSYYKSLHIDLQALVAASLAEGGRSLVAQHDFRVRHTMSYMNSRARSNLSTRKHRESLLVFE